MSWGCGVKLIQGGAYLKKMGFSFPALYLIKKNPGIEVMQYKHSLDESGVVEFFRRRVSVGFIGNSLGVNTHLMAFLRSMCLS